MRVGAYFLVASARADRQQDFLAERVFELFEIERGLTLVAEHLEHGGTTLLRHFYAAALDAHYVHLERFDQKIPVIAAIRAGQRHVNSLRISILCKAFPRRNANMAEIW